MSLTFSEGEGARRADEGLVIPLISLAALASAKLPARLQKSFTFSEGEGARRADEGLVIPLISLAALASLAFGTQAVPGEAKDDPALCSRRSPECVASYKDRASGPDHNSPLYQVVGQHAFFKLS